MDHEKKIQDAFAGQAGKFGKTSYTLAKEDYLNWMVEKLPHKDSFEVLDVAAGTGHLGRALAPLVKKVTAIDLTKEMLAEGEKEAEKAGIKNIEFQLGNAELLSYEDNTFDMVVSRFAIHHFVDPAVKMSEMARVCKKSGFVGIIDLVSPSDRNLAQEYNHWEQARDSSHTKALDPESFINLIRKSGMDLILTESRDIEVDVKDWIDLSKPGKPVADSIKEAVKQNIEGKGETGLRPFVKEGRLKFLHSWMIAVGKK